MVTPSVILIHSAQRKRPGLVRFKANNGWGLLFQHGTQLTALLIRELRRLTRRMIHFQPGKTTFLILTN
ncbi:hypothetical protein [Paenibacillus sp. ISL-20]|uniref:hypothetical protein n=1 Tax=Paenibacillus sp. ISL-20 TaxID=2819163 RepID=UPI001BE64E9C|nr:hypothetical protein [Paenibacillus sp. ISL-20]